MNHLWAEELEKIWKHKTALLYKGEEVPPSPFHSVSIKFEKWWSGPVQ